MRKDINFLVGNDNRNGKIEMLHSPMKVISYLSEFTSLQEGDVISLGGIFIVDELAVKNDKISVKASIIDDHMVFETNVLQPIM